MQRLNLLAVLAVSLSSTLLFAASSSPGPARVLVVYNSNTTADTDSDGVQDSLQTANYYAAKRGVPAINLLGLACTTESGYSAANYSKFISEVVTPIKSKLSALGANNIDIILFCHRLPWTCPDSGGSGVSLDNAIMGLNYWSTTASNIARRTNPYLEANPTFGTDKGYFDHALYKFYSTEMYLVCRLESPLGVTGVLNMVDAARYADRYAAKTAGYYNGNVYVDSQNRKGVATDANLAADPYVQGGSYGSYADTDVNIAYGEHYVLATGLPLKWQKSSDIIGRSGLLFDDGTSAETAPRAMLYGGWYAYNTYLPKVWEWLPGSVACDLDSSSLGWDIRSPNTLAWATNALANGASAVCGVVGEPYTTGHPRPNILIWAMLQGFTFAEAAGLANPSIGWMPLNIGDPLMAPFKAKTLIKDTAAPLFASGYPKITSSVAAGNVVSVLFNDTPEPEVAQVTVQYGPTSSYGQSVTSISFFRQHNLILPDIAAGTTIHYRVIATDPVGNVTTSPDLTFVSPVQRPFGGTPQTIPGIVQCEHFDEGGEGVAYHDRETANYNATSQYRKDTAVEMNSSVPYHLYYHTYSGEWLEYTVNVQQSGNYTLEIVLTNGGDNGAFHIECDGVDKTGPISFPNYSGWYALPIYNVPLTAGQHILRLAIDSVDGVSRRCGSFDYINFTLDSASDTTAPVISAVASSGVTASAATITFTTDEDASTEVEYGPTTAYGFVAKTGVRVKAHSLNLSSLWCTTTYHYRVRSADAAGNAAVSGDYTFNTLATTDTTPPVLSGVAATVNSFCTATVAFTTNENAKCQVEYGTTTSYGNMTTVNYYATTSFSVGLSALAGSTLYHYRVVARDTVGNLTLSPDYTFTTTAGSDITSPTFSAVVADQITSNSARIRWTTSESSDSQVEYGPTTAYGRSNSLNTSRSTQHTMFISGLMPGTLYHYRLKSRDAAGNLGTSVDFTFTTQAIADTFPPALSNIAASGLTNSGATISWTSSEAASTQVEYGTTTAYGSLTSLNSTLLTSHSQALTGLSAGTLYHYRVLSRDAAFNLASSGDFTFTTTSGGDTTPPVISAISAASITSSSASISWTTNEASDTQVEYGLTTSYGTSTTLNTTKVTAHTQGLSGLSASTLYHYRVKSRDAAGNLATSADYSFTTSASNLPPTITSAASAMPNPAAVGQSVSFLVGASDPNADLLSYAWNFGDGATGSGASATHAYAAAGTYTAIVTVSDGRASVTSSVAVTVVVSGTNTITVTKAGQPLAGVYVYAYSASGSYLGKAVLTNSLGKATFSLASPQTVKYRVNNEGAYFWSPLVSVPDDTAINVPASTLVTVLKAGVALSGVYVYAYDAAGTYLNYYRQTDASGKVNFAIANSQQVKFRVSDQGAYFWSAVVSAPGTTTITVPANTTVTVQKAGAPLSGVYVYAYDAAGSYLSYARLTDASGQAVFALAAAPQVKFRVSDQGAYFWSAVVTAPASTTITVPVNMTVTVQKAGTPIVGVYIYAFDAAGNYLNYARLTDASGRAIFALASTPQVKFRVYTQGLYFWSAAVTPPTAVSLSVPADSSVSVLQGTTAVAGVNVYAYTAGDVSLAYSRPTDASGQALFALASGQQVKFSVTVNSQRYWSTVISTPGAVTITVPAAAGAMAGAMAPEAEPDVMAAAEPEPAPQAADLGSVPLGKPFRMKLELPAELAGQRKVTWKVIEPAQLPEGISVSRGKLGGRPSAAGVFVFAVRIEASIRSVGVDGKKLLSKQSIDVTYQLSVVK